MTFSSPFSKAKELPESELTGSDWNSDALTRVIPTATERQPVAAQPPPPPPPRALKRPPAADVETKFFTPQIPVMHPAEAPAAKPASTMRRAIYGLVLVTLGLFAFTSFRKQASPSKASAGPAASTSAAATLQGDRQPLSRPTIQVRAVEAPTVKDAANAFARGDHREALAQYRALSQREPGQAVYQSLIRILERRLTPKRPAD